MSDLKPSLDDQFKEAQLRDIGYATEIKKQELITKIGFWRNLLLQGGLLTALVAALVGTGGWLVTTRMASNQRDLEREKFERQMLLDVLKTQNHDTSRANLRFLLSTELVEDPDGKIKAYLDNLCRKEGRKEALAGALGVGIGGGTMSSGSGGSPGIGIGGDPCLGVK